MVLANDNDRTQRIGSGGQNEHDATSDEARAHYLARRVGRVRSERRGTGRGTRRRQCRTQGGQGAARLGAGRPGHRNADAALRRVPGRRGPGVARRRLHPGRDRATPRARRAPQPPLLPDPARLSG